jgi:predicted dienelactone hydrolase
MTRLKMFCAAAALFIGAAQAGEVGVMNFTFDAPHRDRLVQALVTYPVAEGTRIEYAGDNAVFKGVPVWRDAKPVRKRHPAIVLSHGSGGNAAGMLWLSKRLAENGFVVIAPNHQGSTSGDSRPETTIPATWERKQDVSALLDAIAKSAALREMLDLETITAMGFSLGGQTVLGLAGLRLDAKALADDCESNAPMPGCDWLMHGNAAIPGGVNLREIDAESFNAAYLEPRIKRVIAIDPAIPRAYNMESLSGIAVPVHVLNLGAKGELAEGMDASPVVTAISNAKIANVEGATHFSFLPECKWVASLLIWWEGDDPVCSGNDNLARDEAHDRIADQILAFLRDSES